MDSSDQNTEDTYELNTPVFENTALFKQAEADHHMSLLEKHTLKHDSQLNHEVEREESIEEYSENVDQVLPKRLSMFDKHVAFLEDIPKVIEEEKLERYHGSLLERTMMNQDMSLVLPKLSTVVSEDSPVQLESTSVIIDKENLVDDAVEPRIFSELRQINSQEYVSAIMECLSHDSNELSDPTMPRKFASLSNIQDQEKSLETQIERISISQLETEPLRPTSSAKFEDDKPSKEITKKAAIKSSQYMMIRTIGKGNFAKVKLAKHVATDKFVAIKIIDKSKLSQKVLSKITREVSLMKELSHENIVQLLEVMENETTLYLVMEYASGGELFDHLIMNGCMKEKDARVKFREMISAVYYCHSKKIVHRDLKAENMLLNDKMKIKIADFGFANRFNPDSTLDTFCGSPPYAAPELFMGKRYIGPEVDVWALGVILFTLVSGRLPFDASTVAELKHKVVNLRYEIPYFISNDCEKLLRKMLVVNTSDRASVETILKDPWLNAGGLVPLKENVAREFTLCENKVDLMVDMGFLRSDIQDAFKRNTFNSIRATYVLLKDSTSQINNDISDIQYFNKLKNKRIDERKARPTNIEPAKTEDNIANKKDERKSFENTAAYSTANVGKTIKGLFVRKPEMASGSKEKTSIDINDEKDYQLFKMFSMMGGKKSVDQQLSVPNYGEQDTILSTFNQMVINKHRKIGMFHEDAICPTTAQDVYEKNQITAQSMGLKGACNTKVASKFTVETIQTPTSLKAKKSRLDNDQLENNHISMSQPTLSKIKKKTANISPQPSVGTEKILEKFDINAKPRIATFTFSMNTTSSKHAIDIVIEIIRVLEVLHFSYEFLEKYLVFCWLGNSQLEVYGDTVEWEMEVCRIPVLFMNGVRLKRIFGSSFIYKRIVSSILRSLKI